MFNALVPSLVYSFGRKGDIDSLMILPLELLNAMIDLLHYYRLRSRTRRLTGGIARTMCARNGTKRPEPRCGLTLEWTGRTLYLQRLVI